MNRRVCCGESSVLSQLDGGQKAVQVASNVGVAAKTVRAVARRYEEEGLESALYEKPRPGKQRVLDTGQIQRIIAMVCGPPPQGAARWSVRLIAEEAVEAEAGAPRGPGVHSHSSPEPRTETVAGKKAGASRN